MDIDAIRIQKREAEASFDYETKKAEALESSALLDRRDDPPPRTTQEIPSAPGLPF